MSTTKQPINKKKSQTSVAITKLNAKPSVKEMSFKDIINLDEKELNKQMNDNQKMIGKRSQLQAKVIDITNRLSIAEGEYRKSLIDPTKDSVEMRIEMDCLEKEKQIAMEILQQLFPEDFTAPL